MNEKISLAQDDLEMLKKLLHTYEVCKEYSISLNYDDVVQYEYSTLESEKIIDLYNFRLSDAKQKSISIIELIERIKKHNEPFLMMHNLNLKGGKNFMIYSSADCKKIIYLLPFGRDDG